MKAGAIVTFKWSPLPPPNNYGIYLDRRKRGKHYYIELLTLKGKLELKADHVSKTPPTLPSIRVDGRTEKTLRTKLEALIGKIKSGAFEVEGANGPSLKELREQLDERGLWETIVGTSETGAAGSAGAAAAAGRPFSVAELAGCYYGTDTPTRPQRRAIGECVEGCAAPGIGFFERVRTDAGVAYQPVPLATYRQIRHRIDAYYRLRKALFPPPEPEPESEYDAGPTNSGNTGTTGTTGNTENTAAGNTDDREDGDETDETVDYHVIDALLDRRAIENAGLDDDMAAVFDELCTIIAGYLATDRWRMNEGGGIAGTGQIAIGGFDIRAFIRETMDEYCRTRRLATAAKCILFLRDAGYWTDRDIVAALASRRAARGEYDFSTTFPESVVRSAERLKREIGDEERTLRTDHTARWTVTIDPPDAKDFDDAISFSETAAAYELIVHIADVGHYVRRDSLIDLEAQRRATSVYLPSLVLPMLPARLSEDLCSLRAGEERRAMSVRMVFRKPDLEVVGTEIGKSVIYVNRNLSYPSVDTKIGLHERPYWQMAQFARKLRAQGTRLELATTETRFAIDTAKNRIEYQLKRETPATKMIETFMIAANEAVARFLAAREQPSIYRIHGLPDKSAIREFQAKCKRIGLGFTLDIDFERFEAREDRDTDTKAACASIDAEDREDGEDADEGGASDETADLARSLEAYARFSSFGGITLKIEGADGKRTVFGDDTNGKDGKDGDDGDDGEDARDGSADRDTEDDDPTDRPLLAPLDPEERDHYLDQFNAFLARVASLGSERLRTALPGAVLALLQRANYATTNIGHFGLGSECYTHFTSPIRRYADLAVHRILAAALEADAAGAKDRIDSDDGRAVGDEGENENNSGEHSERGGNGHAVATDLNEEYSEAVLDTLADRCSDQSRAAEQFEYDLKAVCAVLYALQEPECELLRQTHTGTVTGISSTGLFVSFGDLFEGRVPIRALAEGRAVTDDAEAVLYLPEHDIGADAGTIMMVDPDDDPDALPIPAERVLCRLFDPIPVRIKAIDPLTGKIEVVWVK